MQKNMKKVITLLLLIACCSVAQAQNPVGRFVAQAPDGFLLDLAHAFAGQSVFLSDVRSEPVADE